MASAIATGNSTSARAPSAYGAASSERSSSHRVACTAAPIARKIFDAYLLPPEQAAATDAITPVGETPPAGGNEE